MLTDCILDAETDNLMPYTTKIHIVVLRQLGTGHTKRFYDADSFRRVIPKLGKVIFHNGLGFDLAALRKCWGFDFSLGAKVDKWCGTEVEFIDTLHLSQLLNPDRIGGHSIENFAKMFGKEKVGKDITDWSTPTEEMFQRCENDTLVGEMVYNYLLKEAQERLQ